MQDRDLTTAAGGASDQDSSASGEAGGAASGEGEGGRAFANGRYQVVGLLGRGGFGTVYKAYDHNCELYVALKVIDASSREREYTLQLFDSEAKIARRLEHPGIVRVYDYDPNPYEPYIVMSFVEGGTLRDQLAAGQCLPWPEVRKLGIQLADALHYAHERGVRAHRDVKPGNIFRTANGDYQVGDFGIAHASRAAGSRLAEGSLVYGGTSGYMAPEQIASPWAVDARCDVFALGVVLYQALTGHLPYESVALGLDSLRDPAVARRLVEETFTPPQPIHEFDSRVPGDLTRIVERAIQKNPDDRFQTCAEFAAELRAIEERRPVGKGLRWIAASTLVLVGCITGYAYHLHREALQAQRAAMERQSRAEMLRAAKEVEARRLAMEEQSHIAAELLRAADAQKHASQVRAELIAANASSPEADELMLQADARFAAAKEAPSAANYQLALGDYQAAADRFEAALAQAHARADARRQRQIEQAQAKAQAQQAQQRPQLPQDDPSRCERDPFAGGCPDQSLTVESLGIKRLD